MPTQTWKVEYHEATTTQEFNSTRKAAHYVDTFGVNADGSDGAKKAAKTWLEDRGHTIRSINVSVEKDKTLIAYVAAGSVARANQRNAAVRKGLSK